MPEEDRSGGPAVAILSHALWQRRFGSDTTVLGRTITLDANPYTVVGVLAPTLPFAAQYDLLIPLALTRGKFAMPQVIGRLKPGVSLGQASTALDALYQRAHDPKEKGHVVLVGLHDHMVGGSRLSLLVYLSAVGFVLLIACANVANLLLARAARRRREIAVRLAMGASRLRILRQLMTESVLLAGLGAILGLLAALWGKDLLRSLISDLPTLRMDARVLGFTLLLALLTSVLFGLAPAWEASRASLNDALNEGGRPGGATGRPQHRLTRWLVVAQVGLALVLLVGAGLLGQSFLRLRGVDPGFRPDRVLSLTIVLSQPQYPEARSQAAYFERVIERLRGLPGVEAVGANATLPLTPMGMSFSGLEIEGQPSPAPGEYRFIRVGVVNADYFRAMSIPLKQGRSFTDDDRTGKPEVALANESFVRRYFPQTDPLGKHLGGDRDAMTIVGVVGDVRHSVDSPPEPQIYRSYLQAGSGMMSLAVRTRGDPRKLAGAVRSGILSVDKAQPVYSLMTLEERLADSLRPQRIHMLLVSALGVLALGLSVIGLHGVLSFAVAQRTHEIGVRIALGAERGDVLWLVVGEGLRLTVAGVVVGLLAALGLTRLIASLLWGVSAFDPATFAGVAGLLILVALLACYLPARRAARVDPMVALRYE
jgi:putative ABC transport system permease protein